MSAAETEKTNENLIVAFVKSAAQAEDGESVQFGPITATSTATSTGTNVHPLNRRFALDAVPPNEIASTIRWTGDREVPFWLAVTEETREAAAEIARTRTAGGRFIFLGSHTSGRWAHCRAIPRGDHDEP